jgi:hypothetical protein
MVRPVTVLVQRGAGLLRRASSVYHSVCTHSRRSDVRDDAVTAVEHVGDVGVESFAAGSSMETVRRQLSAARVLVDQAGYPT